MEKISSERGNFQTVEAKKGVYHSLRTFLAIGKSGNPRMLGVQGEKLDHKVMNRLFDPGEYQGKDVLVVGGGDSALESAIALSKENNVSISYRGKEFSRPKAENINTINKLSEEGKLQIMFETNISEITETEVKFQEGGCDQKRFCLCAHRKRIAIRIFLKGAELKLKTRGAPSQSGGLHFPSLSPMLFYFGKAGAALPDGNFLYHRVKIIFDYGTLSRQNITSNKLDFNWSHGDRGNCSGS